MPLFSKKGRRFKRINILDLLLLLIIIGLIIGAFTKKTRLNREGLIGTKEVQLRIKVPNREEFLLEYINEEDTVKEFDTGTSLGQIKSIEVEPARRNVVTVDGEIKKAEIPGRFDLFMEIQGQALITDESIISANRPLKIGGQLVLKTKSYVLDSTIIDLKIIEE